jgi:hypothetical protein
VRHQPDHQGRLGLLLHRRPCRRQRLLVPACNWLGFQKICADEGWRLATKDELTAVAGQNGFYAYNWSSWSAMSSPDHAFYVRVTGLLVGAQELLTNRDQHIWTASESVRCVKDK